MKEIPKNGVHNGSADMANVSGASRLGNQGTLYLW